MSFYTDKKPLIVIGTGAFALEMWSSYLGLHLQGVEDWAIMWTAFIIPVMIFYVWATDKNL